MKRIGVIFAMREELDEVLKLVTLETETKIFDLTFYECELGKKELVLVESGVGKVNAARSCQVLIDHMNVDCIFNVGVAGGVDTSVNVLDIVVGERLAQHDFDITPFGHPKGYIPNIDSVYIESDPILVKAAGEATSDSTIHKGVIASGDIFCTEEWMSEKIHHKFNALCVEMEGASIAQVCHLCGVPFLVIRSISDSPNSKDNKLTYEEFLQESSKRVALYLKEIIERIK